jgi:hypothetical protein
MPHLKKACERLCITLDDGTVSERPKVQLSKSCVVERPPWVQIPPVPPEKSPVSPQDLRGFLLFCCDGEGWMSPTAATPVTSRARRLLLVLAVVAALTAVGFLLSRVVVSGWPSNPVVADSGRPGDRTYAPGFVLAAGIAELGYVFRRRWARGVLFAFTRARYAIPGCMTVDILARVAPVGALRSL